MELPIPIELIEQLHRLARTSEKYKGRVFTDTQGNILEDQMDESKDSYDVSE